MIQSLQSLFGRLIPGYIADNIGRWNTFIIACALCGVSELAVWLVAKTSATMIGCAVFFGFMSGAFTSLSGALPISVSPAGEIGYRLGLTYLAFSIPGITMGVIGGAIIESSSFGWSGMEIFAALTCFVGSAITLYSRWLYTDRKLFKRF
jgi:MFS family permease